MNVITKSLTLPNGTEISIETGKLAKQADGAVVVRCGKAMLLATAVSSQDAKEGVDFLPLSVDYQEKFAGFGRIPGGFLKREGRLSDHEVLIARLVDRALRPLFPSDYHADTQIFIQLISGDEEVRPDALAALAASAAIAVSDIPIDEIASEARVIKIGDEYIVNPPASQMEEADIDLIVAATADNIMMVEGEMNEASEAEMLEAIKVAHEVIKSQCALLVELAEAAGKTEKRTYSHENDDEELYNDMYSKMYDKMYKIASSQINDKNKRKELFSAVVEEYNEGVAEDAEINSHVFSRYKGKIQKKASRDAVLNENVRLDGRDFNEVRQIWSEVDYLPSAHGSALFTRGETQSLTSLTLGTKLDEQMIDGAMHKGTNRFILHYNFPGFSTGEVRFLRGPGRREVGHGNLANRALKKVMPNFETLPYTVRIVSDILESNGSSSMATVCAGCLAMMDAGIPVKAPVSGIAMGMISDAETGKYKILSDILGDEDHLGDMDFKVTGTTEGITACQMDIKVDGLSYEVLAEALEQARQGRLHILGEMAKTLAAPRPDFKDHTPRIEVVEIPAKMIGAVIGQGGKVIQEMQATTGTTITIEEAKGMGIVSIFGVSKESVQEAVEKVQLIIKEPEIGEIYDGKVKSVVDFGAFIEFLPGKDGLLHISDIKWERLEAMDGVMEIGEEVRVKLIDIDKRNGKFKLSRKELLPKPEGYVEPVRKPRPPRNDRNDGGRGSNNRRNGGGNRF